MNQITPHTKDHEHEISSNVLSNIFQPIGIHTNQLDEQFLIIERKKSIEEKPIIIPTTLLAHGRDNVLSEHLVKNGVTEILYFKIAEVKKSLIHFFNICKISKTIIIEKEGFHQFKTSHGDFRLFVKNGKIHFADKIPNEYQIKLIGDATKKFKSKDTLEFFNKKFTPILKTSPRLLIALIFSLAAYFYKSFGISPLSLILVGPTSIGKSVIQNFVGNIVKGDAQVTPVNATKTGIHDYCSEQGTYCVYLEDAQGKDAVEPIINLIMDVGNQAKRMRSKRGSFNSIPAKNMECTLLISAEKDLIETAFEYKFNLYNGVLSRIFSIHPGKYGMFDDLCGFSKSSDLVDFIKDNGNKFSSILGDAVISSVAKNLENKKERFNSIKKTIKSKIIKASEISDDLSGQDDRILNGLVFCAFVGRMAISYKHLNLRKEDIDNAIGNLFKEHLIRKTKNSINPQEKEKLIIKIIRNSIKNNMSKILPFKKYHLLPKNNVIGLHLKDDFNDLYLIKPEKFKELIGDHWNNQAFKQLYEKGLIISSKNRGHQYQKRLPNDERASFIAISASILDD